MNTYLLFVLLTLHFCNAHWDERIYTQPNYVNLTDNTNPDITITLSVSEIQGSEGWATVIIDGVPNPAADDWIAVYASSSDIKERAPIKTKYLNDPNYLKTGHIATSLHLINMREDYIIRLYRFASPLSLLAVSKPIVFINKDMPLQGHLSLTAIPNEMMISWSSRDKSNAKVQWGLKGYTFESLASSSTYLLSDLCYPPANSFGYQSPGWIHHAKMVDLIPGKVYHYRYGNDLGWSKDHTFIARSNRHVSLIAFADMGKWDTDGSGGRRDDKASVEVVRHLQSASDQTDLMLLFGDLSYSVGFLSQWEEYMHMIESVGTKIPIMGSVGNHEFDGGECGVPYRARFKMPTPDKHDYYSFNYGNIHILMMDTENDFSQNSAQFKFIKEDLKNVNRSEYPWIIVTSHRPFYIDTKDQPYPMQETAENLRIIYEDMFVENKVDLVLTGHHHSYQRTCPVYKEKCQVPGYPVHLVIGTAGSNLFHLFQEPTPEWIVFESDKDYGYSIITTDDKSLTLNFISVTRDKIIDQVKIIK